MGSFTLVSTGNNTLSTDINQYANILNGTTNGVVTISNAPGTTPIVSSLTSAPVSNVRALDCIVSGDTFYRVSLVVNSTGYGGIDAGAGASPTATMTATSTGWSFGQGIGVSGGVTATSLSVGSVTVSSGNISAGSGSGTFNTLVANSAGGNTYYGSQNFSGTGTGTYTHGLSAAPNFVGVIQNVSNSTTTVGVDSIGSTTCHVNINGSFAFLAHAIKN